VEVELERLPLIRRNQTALVFGRFTLLTDTAQPWNMADDFVERYRTMIHDRFNPFAPDKEIPINPPSSSGPDPFAPEVEPLQGRRRGGLAG